MADQILKVTKEILLSPYWVPADIPSEYNHNIDQGFRLSKISAGQPLLVPITPLMENILERFDGVKTIKVNDGEFKAEKWLNEVVFQQLINEFPCAENYDENINILSVEHYNLDCLRNHHDKPRRIVPGLVEQRVELINQYKEKTDWLSLYNMLSNDNLFKFAIEVVLDSMPVVEADKDFEQVSGPFQAKHSNVCYPFFFNDRTVDKNTGLTYADVTLNMAKQIDLNWIRNNNFSVVLGRNNRKGRLIIAPGRVTNIYLSRLSRVEIEALKGYDNQFAGYRPANELKVVLTRLAMEALKYNLIYYNLDQEHYDLTINEFFIVLIGVMSYYKARGHLSKKLALVRTNLARATKVIDGLSGRFETFYGRMFSGSIDTNRGDGLIMSLINVYAQMKCDPGWYRSIYQNNKLCFQVMGDDLLTPFRRNHSSKEGIESIFKSLGFKPHPTKAVCGIFFLQYRLFMYKDKLIMAYPWTRVLESMLFKERPVFLGKYGWLMSQYQQLAKIVEYDKALDSIIKILGPFDKLQFGVFMTVDEIMAKVIREDAEAVSKGEDPSFIKLSDGDPLKARHYDGQDDDLSGWNGSFITMIHNAVKESWYRIFGTGVPPQCS